MLVVTNIGLKGDPGNDAFSSTVEGLNDTVGPERSMGETIALKVTFPTKPLRRVNTIPTFALVLFLIKNWFGSICIRKSA
jgi:hypothetical protein